MLWLGVLQSLEGGAETIQGQLGKFKQTRSFFQQQHSGELVPVTSPLNHIICLSAACVSCSAHSVSAEIRLCTLPVTSIVRNES